MRIWLDEEFIEDGKTIDLVSIGLVAEDGRKYYAQSLEFDPNKASDWVEQNVLAQLVVCRAQTLDGPAPEWYRSKTAHGLARLAGNTCSHVNCTWRSREELRAEILAFCGPAQYGKPEFWGYYADYDWVAFCQLFGTMMGLPKGFPMYCRDLKQWCDMLGNPKLPDQGKGEHNAIADALWNREAWAFLRDYEVKLLGSVRQP